MTNEQFVAELVGLLIAAMVMGWRAKVRECGAWTATDPDGPDDDPTPLEVVEVGGES